MVISDSNFANKVAPATAAILHLSPKNTDFRRIFVNPVLINAKIVYISRWSGVTKQMSAFKDRKSGRRVSSGY